MRHSPGFGGRADRVPLGDEGGFRFFVVEAKLGALLAFHVLLRVDAFDQQGAVADPIIELRGGEHDRQRHSDRDLHRDRADADEQRIPVRTEVGGGGVVV